MKQHDPKLQAQYLDQIKDMFGGKALTELVKKRKVEITAADELPPPFKMRCDAATFFGDQDNFEVFLQTDSAADPDKRKELLIHELRHIQQFNDVGRWHKNHTCLGGAATRKAFIQNLLIEADAYSFQSLALAPVTAAGRVMEIPAGIFGEGKIFQDEKEFCRANFTKTMLYGLSAYLADYQGVIRDLIKAAPLDIEEARGYFANVPAAGAFEPSAQLTDIYGAKFMKQTSMRAVQDLFLRMIPLEYRAPLRKYDHFMAAIGTMQQDEYKAAREDLLNRFDPYFASNNIKRKSMSQAEINSRAEKIEKMVFQDDANSRAEALVQKHADLFKGNNVKIRPL